MARSGWVAVAITALLVVGLGNQVTIDRAAEARGGTNDLLRSVISFPTWSTDAYGLGTKMVGPLFLKIILLLFSVFLGAGLASRGGASTAAFLAGWGAVMVSAAFAGAVFLVVADAVAYKGDLADQQGGLLAVAVEGLNSGVQFGLYTGWLVGLGVLVTARTARPEPEWAVPAPNQPPAAAPATSTSYPTEYPPLPGSGEWSGLTAPLRAVGHPTPPATRPPAAPASAQDPAEPLRHTADDTEAGPLWPRSLPSTAPGGGAYSAERERRRPNWTRWSSRDEGE